MRIFSKTKDRHCKTKTLEPDLEGISNILNLIANPPNKRKHPNENDLKGDYDEWFDGGAIKYVTGSTRYYFEGGVVVHAAVQLEINFIIEFPNGKKISLREEVQ